MPRSRKVYFRKSKRSKTRKYQFRKPKRSKRLKTRRRRARGRSQKLFTRQLTGRFSGGELKNPIESNKKLKELVKNWISNKDIEDITNKYGHIRDWNTSKITDMSELFWWSAFNEDISKWDVSKVTNMGNMFYKATNFNKPLNDWDVSKVTNMEVMFADATSFNQPLNSWGNKLGKVTNMFNMFSGATNFNQPLNDWNVSKVIHMNKMFSGATNFNQPLNDWDVSNVTNMSDMFYNATNFNQPLNNWNVSKVTNMGGMFADAIKFNQPLDKWHNKLGEVTNMYGMFEGATNLNQDLSSWNLTNVTNVNDMFSWARMRDTTAYLPTVPTVLSEQEEQEEQQRQEEEEEEWLRTQEEQRQRRRQEEQEMMLNRKRIDEKHLQMEYNDTTSSIFPKDFMVFDSVFQVDVNLCEYINESTDNLIFIHGKQYGLLDKEQLKKMIGIPSAETLYKEKIVYQCKEVKEHALMISEDNIVGGPKLNMDIISIQGLMIPLEYIDYVIKNNYQIYITECDSKAEVPIVSFKVRMAKGDEQGAAVVGANHCQSLMPIKSCKLNYIKNSVLTTLCEQAPVTKQLEGGKRKKKKKPKRRTKKRRLPENVN